MLLTNYPLFVRFIVWNAALPSQIGALCQHCYLDLQPLFNWNTKQLFIYLEAEYANGQGVCHSFFFAQIVSKGSMYKLVIMLVVSGKSQWVMRHYIYSLCTAWSRDRPGRHHPFHECRTKLCSIFSAF